MSENLVSSQSTLNFFILHNINFASQQLQFVYFILGIIAGGDREYKGSSNQEQHFTLERTRSNSCCATIEYITYPTKATTDQRKPSLIFLVFVRRTFQLNN